MDLRSVGRELLGLLLITAVAIQNLVELVVGQVIVVPAVAQYSAAREAGQELTLRIQEVLAGQQEAMLLVVVQEEVYQIRQERPVRLAIHRTVGLAAAVAVAVVRPLLVTVVTVVQLVVVAVVVEPEPPAVVLGDPGDGVKSG